MNRIKKRVHRCVIIMLTAFTFFYSQIVFATQAWQQLPPTPVLPKALQSGYAPIHGVRIWYAIYGHGQPVILLHGGLANSNYWGYQVPVLAKYYQVIIMDSRGHGRSTLNAEPLSYHLMANDVLGLMNFLKIKRAAIVGWSAGGILGLDIAIHHPERITKLFAFAANSNPKDTMDVSHNPIFKKYFIRTKNEYEQLSTTPTQYNEFAKEIKKIWEEHYFTKAELNSIKTPTWIVDGDHDEGIKRENTEFMAAQIPQAGLLIQPNVSHFSFMQDPEQFNNDLLHFLKDASNK